MTWALDLYYNPPANRDRENQLTERIGALGGRFDFREEPVGAGICLTFECDDDMHAENAAAALRSHGEHMEGPYDCGT